MIIRNRLIPFGSFLAINLCGLIFVRKDYAFTPTDLNHERIHTRQQLELLFLPFFLLYLLEWLFRLIQIFFNPNLNPNPNHSPLTLNPNPSPPRGEPERGFNPFLRAYYRISFEREAYLHQSDSDYLRHRPFFAWLRYLR
jgi:hypothetical protein